MTPVRERLNNLSARYPGGVMSLAHHNLGLYIMVAECSFIGVFLYGVLISLINLSRTPESVIWPCMGSFNVRVCFVILVLWLALWFHSGVCCYISENELFFQTGSLPLFVEMIFNCPAVYCYRLWYCVSY